VNEYTPEGRRTDSACALSYDSYSPPRYPIPGAGTPPGDLVTELMSLQCDPLNFDGIS